MRDKSPVGRMHTLIPALRQCATAPMLFPPALAAAFFGMLSLPQTYYPAAPKPVLTVHTEYHSVSPVEVDRRISRPIEKTAASLPGVTSTYAAATQGKSDVYLIYRTGLSPEIASFRLRRSMAKLTESLPEGINGPHVYEGGEHNLPVWVAAFPEEEENRARTFAEEVSKFHPGIRVEGPKEQKTEYRVQVDLPAASKAEIGPLSLISRISSDFSTSRFVNEDGNLILSGSGPSGSDVQELSVQEPAETRPVAFSEISRIFIEESPKRRIERLNGEACLFVSVYNGGGERTVSLCRSLEELRQRYPEAHTVLNRGGDIGGILQEILLSVGFGTLLVFLLIARKNSTARAIPLLTVIPVSVGAAAVSLYLSDTSLNMMTLSGIAVSIGLSIDTSVIAGEVMRLHGREAFHARTAAPIFLSTLTTAAVFLPLPFFPPNVRTQLIPFAVVIVPAVSASTVYTLLPLPRFLEDTHDKSAGSSYIHRSMRKVYRFSTPFRTCPVATFAVLLVAVFLAGAAAVRLSFSPYPSIPDKSLSFRYEFPRGTLASAVDEALTPVEHFLSPRAEELRLSLSPEQGRITLKPEEGESTAELLELTRDRFAGTSYGGRLFTGGKSGDEGRIRIRFFGADYAEARRRATAGAEKILTIFPDSDISFNFKKPVPSYHLRIDSEEAPMDSAVNLFWSITEAPFHKTISGREELEVKFASTVSSSPISSMDKMLTSLASTSQEGSPPLSEKISVKRRRVPGAVYRRDGVPSAAVTLHSSSLRRELLARELRPLLPGAEVAPDLEEDLRLKRSILLFIVSAAAVIAVTLYGFFGTVSATIATLLQIPLSYTAPLFLLRILDLQLSVPGLAGFLLLAGVSVNNGIVLFGSGGGGSSRKIISNASVDRFSAGWLRVLSDLEPVQHLAEKDRPLLLSSLTTAAGVLPAAFAGISSGEILSAGVMTPLSTVIASGTVGSYLLLYVQSGLILGFRDRLLRKSSSVERPRNRKAPFHNPRVRDLFFRIRSILRL